MLAPTRHLHIVLRRSSSSAYQAGKLEREAQEFAQAVAERIASNKEASSTIVNSLDDTSKEKLLKALLASDDSQGGALSQKYVDRLFKEHDTLAPFGQLQRSEFEAALQADRLLAAAKSATPIPPAQTSYFSIALASSIPFIGMGAIDNSIMLVAGSEIDHLFGAKLGLTTLAAAGLGNMVSDVAGVSMADRIENLTRKVKWFNEKTSKANRTRSGRAARLTGSVVGVAFGCLLGMTPLLFMDEN